MTTLRMGFIGAGNMAGALLGGLRAAGVPASLLGASDPREARLEQLAAEHGIRTSVDNAELARWAEVVVLAVKPQVLDLVAPVLAASLPADRLVVSILAGVSTARLEACFPEPRRVIRAMPNAPALVGAGATAVATGRHATADDLGLARRLFESVGEVVVVGEAQMDAVTGLSGSGPAYVMTFIDALADGGVRAGLPRDTALRLATQTVLGSARLLSETGQHPAQVEDLVTSPGGTTIHGLAALERGGLRSAVIEAVWAAAERSAQLGR